MSPGSKSTPLGASPPEEDEKPALTAEKLAQTYFQAELDTHHGTVSTLQTEVVVILNDAVYGHRFSRPRTTKGNLSSIVERPERIKASVLGISTAYVRLGGRHTEGVCPPHPTRDIYNLPNVPFRIHKTTRQLSLLSLAVTNVHGTKWMDELKKMCDSAESRLAMGGKELQRTDMVKSPDHPRPEKLHEGDLYLCSESRNAMEGALGAVCEAVDTVFGSGPRRAFVGVRPPGHHCSASMPSGFCWVNNVHVGIMHAAMNHNLTHAAIIDFDLHHGDGSQDITWNHNARSQLPIKNAAAWKKTSIGYYSLHDINSYPCEQGDPEKVKNASLCIDNAHGQSIWNVHLQPWGSEQEFWQLYQSKYSILLEKTRNYLKNQAEQLRAAGQIPKAAIFFSAGFDASEWESLGMQRHAVNVPTQFYARIAEDVTRLAAEEGLYTAGRVISVLEGGYSDRALCSGVLSHLSGLVGVEASQEQGEGHSRLGRGMGQHHLGMVPDEMQESSTISALTSTYDPKWWASSELDKLESVMEGPKSPPRKPRKSNTPTYCSPTHASTAKLVDPLRMRRSLSSLNSASRLTARAPSPPPPEVPWTIAAHELSKILIPSNRQTDSYRAEELNAEASKARRDRQSAIIGVPVTQSTATVVPRRPSSKMALRERRGKAASPINGPGMEVGGKDRRRTVGHTVENSSLLNGNGDERPSTGDAQRGATEALVAEAPPLRRVSRRLSGASIDLVGARQSVDQLTQGHEGGPATVIQPIRPSTVDRTQSDGRLPVKKVRQTPATTTRKPTESKPPRSVKKPAAARPKAGVKSESITVKSPLASTAGSSPPVDDMDSLTKGMRKIKINLVTPAQKAAREKARLEVEKASSTASRLHPIKDERDQPSFEPVGTKASTTIDQEGKIGLEDQLHPHEMISDGYQTPSRNTAPDVSTVYPADIKIQPYESPDVVDPVLTPVHNEPAFFIPYQPEGPEPVALSPQEPLQWLTPNAPPSYANTPAATPSPMKKDSLFHYASAGIPFGPRFGKPGLKQDLSTTQDDDRETATDFRPPTQVTWDKPEPPQEQ